MGWPIYLLTFSSGSVRREVWPCCLDSKENVVILKLDGKWGWGRGLFTGENVNTTTWTSSCMELFILIYLKAQSNSTIASFSPFPKESKTTGYRKVPTNQMTKETFLRQWHNISNSFTPHYYCQHPASAPSRPLQVELPHCLPRGAFLLD
jgi:hypothetical protein